ncbi:hypothetical protein B0H13DRAFT_1879243 [Mycena leptocephala]|nr:hypothetical protein B0H13DRAFT_1879243 [Mycena leptocephala]
MLAWAANAHILTFFNIDKLPIQLTSPTTPQRGNTDLFHAQNSSAAIHLGSHSIHVESFLLLTGTPTRAKRPRSMQCCHGTPYASPRCHNLAANPFQEIGNVLRVQGQSSRLWTKNRQLFVTRTRSANKPCRKPRADVTVAFRDARRRKIGLCCRHRVCGCPHRRNKQALAQRARRDRENAAKTAAASAGPSKFTRAPAPAPGAISARSIGQLARSQHEQEQAAAAHILTLPQTQAALAPPRLFICLPVHPAGAPSPADDDDEFPRYMHISMARRPRTPSPDTVPPQARMILLLHLDDSDNNAGTFTLDPEQWSNTFNDHAKVQVTENSAAAPKAPLKSVKWYVSIGGYLSGIVSSLEGEPMQECFRVEVDNIAFLGVYTPLVSTPSPALTVSTSGASGSSAGSKKPRFSYSKCNSGPFDVTAVKIGCSR